MKSVEKRIVGGSVGRFLVGIRTQNVEFTEIILRFVVCRSSGGGVGGRGIGEECIGVTRGRSKSVSSRGVEKKIVIVVLLRVCLHLKESVIVVGIVKVVIQIVQIVIIVKVVIVVWLNMKKIVIVIKVVVVGLSGLIIGRKNILKRIHWICVHVIHSIYVIHVIHVIIHIIIHIEGVIHIIIHVIIHVEGVIHIIIHVVHVIQVIIIDIEGVGGVEVVEGERVVLS